MRRRAGSKPSPLRSPAMAFETVTGYCWPHSVQGGDTVGLHLSSSGGRAVSPPENPVATHVVFGTVPVQPAKTCTPARFPRLFAVRIAPVFAQVPLTRSTVKLTVVLTQFAPSNVLTVKVMLLAPKLPSTTPSVTLAVPDRLGTGVRARVRLVPVPPPRTRLASGNSC